jgi:hypothetical protein
MTLMLLYISLQATWKNSAPVARKPPMGISDSYLLHLVAIIEPQAIYHPRLPAPFPSNTQGVLGQLTSASAGSSVPLDSSATSGSLRPLDSSGPSVPSGSPGKYQVDVQA